MDLNNSPSMSASCPDCRAVFTIPPDDQLWYARFAVPPAKRCPVCRLMRRLAERNTRKLCYRACSKTGQRILSQHQPDRAFPVYSCEAWWDNGWDATEYGMDYDFRRSFFEQFLELKNRTPHTALYVVGGTLHNSDYTNCTGYIKNCYLISESDYNEDCYYSNLLKNCRSCADCSVCYNSELCYQCLDCIGCYNLLYSQNCTDCRDSLMLNSCRSCSDCIGCINLRRKQYCIHNRQYSAEEYRSLKEEMQVDSRAGIDALRNASRAFFAAEPQRALFQENNQNSIGSYLYNSKNAFYCFDSKDLEDCRYCAKVSLHVKDCMDYNSWGDHAELLYQCSACGDNVYDMKFCSTCVAGCSGLEYCFGCAHSRSLFGCANMKGQEFCILNKKYSPQQYSALKDRIIEQMRSRGEYGEFFPARLCSFAYNESVAMDYYPLTREEALLRGFAWRAEEQRDHKIHGAALPDRAQQIEPGLAAARPACDLCGRAYRFIAQELDYYRINGLCPPLECPDCRHQARMALRTPPDLRSAQCSLCSAAILTAYPPESQLKVCCDSCYLAEAY